MPVRCEVTLDAGFLLAGAVMILLLPLRWALAWFVSVTVHELGHLAAAWLLGVPVYGVCFGLTGAKIHTGPMTGKQELLCSLSGPAAGLALLLFARWMPCTAVCAFFHTAVNLIPLGNLDGGRAIRCLLRKIPCKPAEEGLQ